MSNKPYKFFTDGDPVAYAGASSAQKPVYVWYKRNSKEEIIEESPEFPKAAEAKQWIETECWEDEPADEGWTREVKTVYKDLQDAYDATDEVMKDYLKTAKKFCREGKEPIMIAYLTPTGLKTKDIKGLEDRYQFNRLNTVKPKYLPQCRQYLLDNYPFFKMAKKGYEADTHVVGRAEMLGDVGCTMSIDKDLDQVEGAWHINMNEPLANRTCVLSTEVGRLWTEQTFRGKDKTKGDGFMWLCYQAVVGDVSDGYKGLSGVGDKAAVKALKDCTTKEECVTALFELYKKKSKKGYECKKLKALQKENPEDETLYAKSGEFKYISWDGVLHSKTIYEMIQQHFELAYQERSPHDVFNLEEYLEIPKENTDEA